MEENTGKEQFDNQANSLSAIPSDEIITVKDTETIYPIQEKENMEVHHHPDIHHKPKEWKEYFLEFLKTTLKGPFIESLLSQKMQAVKLIKLIDSEYE